MLWTDGRAFAAPKAALAALAAAGVLSACTTPLSAAGPASPLTPTEQYAIQVDQTPDQLALTPHPGGMSANQQAAAAAFAARWRATGEGDIAIRTPSDTDPLAVDRTSGDLVASLRAAGVPAERLRVGAYDAAGIPGSPIIASFLRYEARGPNCEGGWDNLTSTRNNTPMTHFGCAVTANLAAMIADPRDLIAPAASDAPDAGRRAVVLGKYRSGEVTSAARDEQATGTVSNAVQ